MRFLGRLLFLFILIFLLLSCASVAKSGTKINNVSPKDKEKIDDKIKEKESDLISYGKDSEVQLYITNNMKYYVVGNMNVLKMNERELKYNSIDTSIVKISQTNMAGNDGIMLTYYDIRIFLSKTDKISDNTIVGIYEPARATWVFGQDINNTSHSIELKNGRFILGPVKIELRSMSRLYR